MGLGLLGSADVTLLSDKWRSTAQTCVLTVCVAALGIVAFVKLGDLQIILVTLGLLFVVNQKALRLDMKGLKKITNKMEQDYFAEGKTCKGGVNPYPPTTARPEIRPKGQQPKGE